MVNSPSGRRWLETQLRRLGSQEALSAEMSRRAKLVKHRPGGGFRDPEVARKAGIKGGSKWTTERKAAHSTHMKQLRKQRGNNWNKDNWHK